MPRDFDISPYFEIVKPTIVQGFDYTALHWADRQKPLREVAGELSVFPDPFGSPPLAPEEIDAQAPLPAEEVATDARETPEPVERVSASNHTQASELAA
jgi:hypothetical protein